MVANSTNRYSKQMKTFKCAWPQQAGDFVLAGDEIHVYCASLNQPPSSVQQLAQTLSTDELMRAERFYFGHHRKQFTAGRGVLRMILGHYLNIGASQLQFIYGPKGKPALAKDWGGGTIRFNMSHSHELALYAVMLDREIGVDVEYMHPIAEMEQIAERFFSKKENGVFRALPERKKTEAFYNCWTRKEAFIKAIGDGLSLPLDKFDVTLAPGQPCRLLGIKGDSMDASRWFIQELEPAPGFTAALAVQGNGWRLKCWQWED